MTLHRLIAERLPWLSPKEQPRRQHLRLEWRVITPEGAELVARTPHPFEDGAAALLTIHHALLGDLVTLRHAGAAHDSFLPMRANPYRQTSPLHFAWASSWRISLLRPHPEADHLNCHQRRREASAWRSAPGLAAL